jgi:[lysine-biosynthesis-protein LysW]---L-2-aminoadipate ligase
VALLLAGRLTPTNVALLDAARELGTDAVLLPPELAASRARPGDVVLPRLDVLPTLDGIEPGLSLLDGLARRGVRVVNGSGTIVAAHDKLATALRLAAAGVPHPRTAQVGQEEPERGRHPAFPVVVKPRFGSWGRDVHRCRSENELQMLLAQLAGRSWFERQGALVQELVPPRGHDLRVLVAAGGVVGAVRRVAAPGEWRTNVGLGGHREAVVPPPEARAVAIAATRAISGGFVGVDLLPSGDGWIVLELNGCVDFTHEYGLFGGDPFVEVVSALERLGDRGAALEPVLA